MLCDYRLTDEGMIITNEEFRKLLGVFYDSSPNIVPTIMNAEPNDEMMIILKEMLKEAHETTMLIQKVPGPRPMPPGNPVGVIIKPATKYTTCISNISS